MTQAIADPFTDEKFAQLDLSTGPKSMVEALSPIVDEHPEFAPTDEEVIVADGSGEPEPVTPPAPVVVTPAQPETYEYPDGSTVTLSKTSKGWCATLDSGGKAPEKFYGRTKDELLTNVLAAKLHATQHIRELNKKIKLTAKPVAPTPQERPAPQVRNLTADETYEIKNLLTTNPDLAFSTLFQKKTGMTLEELVGLAEEGRFAKDELDSEAVAKTFMMAHPEYYADPDFANYLMIVGLLSKEKLGKTLDASSRESVNATMKALIRGGHWTVENLEEAFDELSEAGLLVANPDASEDEDEEIPLPVVPPQPVAVAPVVPKPAPPAPIADPRIAGRRVGQRAGLGIRQNEVSAPVPETPRSLSADEFDNLSDTEISDLFSGIRRAAATRPRR